MANGHLLAAPDRIVTDLVSILEPHGISCELEYEKECTHDPYVIDLTALRCASGNTHVDVGIEKRRGRNGADIVLIPERRSMFRRDLDSEALAEQIVKILCDHGATNEPHARCEDLE
jgi:hypothetical protein